MAVRVQIDGVGTVELGDDFNKLSPDAQNAVIGSIATQSANGVTSSLGGTPLKGPWDDYAKPGPWTDYQSQGSTPGGSKGPIDFSDVPNAQPGPLSFDDLVPRNTQPGAPIEVEGPGGVIVEFPAGTSRDVMAAAMRKKFALSMGPSAQDSPTQPNFAASVDGPTDFGPPSNAAAAPNQMPYTEQMGNAFGAIAKGAGGISKVLANGMTMGLADQGVAALRAATGDAPSYTDAIKQEQGQTNAVGAGVPGLNTGLQVAGGLLGGAGLLRSGLSLGGRAMEAGAGPLAKAAGFGADAAIAGGVGGASGVTSGNPSDYVQGAKTGAEIGGLLGGALPLAGSALGAAYRTAAPFFAQPATGMGRTATGLLSSAMTPKAAAALGELGPDAVLADASPSFQGMTQGVVAKPGPAADNIVEALSARQKAAPTRLNADLDTNLGPAMSPVQLQSAMTSRMGANSPAYENALNNAPSVDTTNTIAEIGQRLNGLLPGTPEHNVLSRFRDMVRPQDASGNFNPVTDARQLLAGRQYLDNAINYGDPLAGLSPGAAQAEGSALTPVRQALSQDLHDQVSGLASADLTHATAERGLNSIEVGSNALKGGQTAMWPDDLAAHVDAQPLEGQALTRAGARSAIQTQVGTNPNDLATLRRTFGDTEDFNRAKAGLLFGEEPTQNMIKAIDRENTFAQTAGPVIAGSRTAPMAIASKAIDDATAPRDFILPKNASTLGLLAHAGEWGLRKGAGVMAGLTGDTTREQLARGLLSSGPERDTLIQGLLADQLMRSQRGQALTGLLSNPGIARGLLAGRRPGDP